MLSDIALDGAYSSTKRDLLPHKMDRYQLFNLFYLSFI
jgi:hypothetical protein